MESFFERYRNLVVLLVVLVAQIVGLAMQVHRTGSGGMSLDPRDSAGVRLLRLWANALVSPPERLIHSSGLGVTDLWQNYIDLHRVRQQNQDLKKTIDRLRLEQAALLEDARQGQRLQALMNFQEKYIYKTMAAQVIGSSGSNQSRVFYLDKGSDEGLSRDMAVISPDGIVGKLREVYPHSAQVLVINDQTSGAGVILETTRIRGILRGNAAGETQIVGIMADQRILPGEKVLTAGGDQIFPRGLPVGVVEKVVRDPDRDSFIDVLVKPAAHLDRLDEVLVITSTEPKFPSDQQKDMATSEALKGAEVEEEKAQKRASEIMAERLPGLIDPNLPADQQPLNDSTPPNPVSHTPLPLHPDRFTPGPGDSAPETGQPGEADQTTAAPKSVEQKKAAAPGKVPEKPPSAAPAKPNASTQPQRNP
ncbi:MAG: rod shape-determining protein MreC [Terracidiphilus sp.]